MKKILVAILMCLALAWPGRAWGAVAYVNESNGYQNGSAAETVATAALSTTTGNLINVNINDSGGVVTSVTDTASNTYVACSDCHNGLVNIWYAKNVTGNASNVVTAHFSNAVSYASIAQIQLSGADTTSPYQTYAIAPEYYQYGSLETGSYTPTTAGSMTIISSAKPDAVNISTNAAYTIIDNNAFLGSAYISNPALSPQTTTVYYSGNGNATISLAVFVPSSGSGTPTTKVSVIDE